MPKKIYAGAAWHALKRSLFVYGIDQHGQKKKLADYLKVNKSQVTRWLNSKGGKAEPPYSMGKRIEKYLEKVPFRGV